MPIFDAEVIGTAEIEAQAVAWLNDHHGAWRLAVLDLFLKAGTVFGVLEQLTPRTAREQVIVLTIPQPRKIEIDFWRLGLWLSTTRRCSSRNLLITA